MDLWVVKYASRRSRDRGFFGAIHRSEASGIRAFWPRARVSARRLWEQGAEPDGRGSRPGSEVSSAVRTPTRARAREAN